MKRIISLALALLTVAFALVSCGESAKFNISAAKSIADLNGAKIAAQAGTFHSEGALVQINGAKTSTYPEFADLLTAVTSGAVDGYIAEEPTAFSVCLSDDTLAYLPLKNNDTGFKADDSDVGIAVGLVKGSALLEKVNAIIAEIPTETRMALMEQMVKISAGENVTELALKSETPATVNGTFKVAMECAYEPFNWTETEAKSVGAVPISGEGKDGLYANGYDVQIAKYIANKLGMALEIYSYEWDSLIPALQSGNVDAIAAGMSPTAERKLEIDFSDVYYESNLVIIYKK